MTHGGNNPTDLEKWVEVVKERENSQLYNMWA